MKGKEALRGKQRDFICRVLVVLACEWGIDRMEDGSRERIR